MRIVAYALLSVLAGGFNTSAEVQTTRPPYQLVDVLVWGTHVETDLNRYPADVRRELDQHIRRSKDYRSPRRAPVGSSEFEMGYNAQVGYERLLVAISDDARAASLAVAYVDDLGPCYEWEGFHDCPESEAVFATRYQATHPGGPFTEFLHLLAAHRWLCTAEAYEHEKEPQDAVRSRRAYEEAVPTARQSASLLIRTAAAELTARGRCFVER
jgi:hypothetical protein